MTAVLWTLLVVAQDETAVEKAARFLAAQQEADGSLKVEEKMRSARRGVTALGALAWLAAGRDATDPNVSRALMALMAVIDDARADTFDYAMATLALSEALMITRWNDDNARRMLLGKIEKAADTIVKSQNRAGGWGYELSNADQDAETVRLAAMLFALRSAKKAGARIGDETFDRAFRRLEEVHSRKNGLFYDRPGDADREKFNPSVGANAGAVALFAALKGKTEAASKAAEWIRSLSVDTATGRLREDVASTGNGLEQHGYYELLMQALARRLTEEDQTFKDWHAQVWRKLEQNADGSFAGAVPSYATSMAILIRSVGTSRLYWLSK